MLYSARASTDGIIGEVKSYASRLAIEKYYDMITRFKLWDGRKVTVETTMTGYEAQYDGESEKKRITSNDYMRIVITGNIVERI
jgi:hypothetical protein